MNSDLAWPGPGPVPDGVDQDKPSQARVYDVHLGGRHNFAADRRVAAEVAARMPELPTVLRANRDFLRRSVQHLVDQGVRQFLDLGSGIPTSGNVHDVAQQANAECRVLYVDNDPVAVAHSQEILAGNPWASAIEGDLTLPDQVLGNRELRDLLDLNQPLAVLMVAVLHFQPDTDRCAAIIKDYTKAIAPGSYLVISHATAGERAPGRVRDAAEVFSSNIGGFYLRDREQVARLFGDLNLIDPGLVNMTEWHPEPHNPLPPHDQNP
ncbi:MAG TPA: SAM-dependent methyltransferase, partial [Pseudonocardiaceae bacterium]|nr:SAM-dependent methyltransferase [Pseudonocardiaceae bacterium]